MFQFIAAPRSAWLAPASTGRTASPSRRKVPARATTRSPSASPSRTSTSAPAASPVLILRVSTRLRAHDLHGGAVAAVENRRGRHGEAAAVGGVDDAAGEARRRAGPGCRRGRCARGRAGSPCRPPARPGARCRPPSPRPATSTRARLADADGRQPRLGHLGVELDLALGDDAEHRLGGAGGVAADARHAPADDAVGRRRHLDAPAPPHQLAALRLDLRLLGLGDVQSVLGGRQLRLGRAGCLLALVEHRLGHMAGLAQRLGALERVAALDEPRLGLHDRGLGLGDRPRRRGRARRRSGPAGRRAYRRPAAPARRPSSRACLRRPAPR